MLVYIRKCYSTDHHSFNGPHVVLPFMRRSEVYSQLERVYTDTSSTDKQAKRNDKFQLNMIFATGSIHLGDKDISHPPPRDYQCTAMEEIDVFADLPGDQQIQNTLLLLLFLTQNDVGIGSHWDLSRQAIRICVENGYHKASASVSNPADEQMRRRLFWCSYVSERHQSYILGRPYVLHEDDITIEVGSLTITH